MDHQAEDVRRFSCQPRILVLNGLGTGKTATVAWWLQEHWLGGRLDDVIIVGPDMVLDGWRETFLDTAWPGDLVEFIDARPPDHSLIREAMTTPVGPDPAKLRVFFTTCYGISDLAPMNRVNKPTEEAQEFLSGVRGRLTAFIVDEAQSVALPVTEQGKSARAIADSSTYVAGITATPNGNTKSLRWWGLIRLVRPDVLARIPNVRMFDPHPANGSFDAFKARYGFLMDPMAKKGRTFKLHRAFVVDVDVRKLTREVMPIIAPFTVSRRKEDCLNLPEKVMSVRAVDMSPRVARMMADLVEEDRLVLGSSVIVPSNVLEERLRVMELSGGFIAGVPVHSQKLELLRDLLEDELDEDPLSKPRLIWASRTKPLMAAALVAAGVAPDEALHWDFDDYQSVLARAWKGGVGLIHGQTTEAKRVSVQAAWRAGEIHTVVAHPGVAGAGLNWQHVRVSIYYDQPLGSIARQQSEDRVHRKGLEHTAVYYDLVLRGGPDSEVLMAHREQRSVEGALLRWLVDFHASASA